ncbi:MAG: MFS transporter [Isosphaeraceae bacterium]
MSRLEHEPSTDATAAGPPSNAWAWGVCWLMFASTVLNYMDRQAMSVVEKPIRAEFNLSNTEFGWVMGVFLLSYALFQLPAGFLVDRCDLRRTYAGAVALWSLAGMASALSPILGILLVIRALLGVGESFNWPCALRVTGRILPPSDRSLGNGIFNSGAAVGAVLTPWTVTPLAAYFGWRVAFLVTGALGFVWVAVWLGLLRGGVAARLASPAQEPVEKADQGVRAGLSQPAFRAFGVVAVVSIGIGLTALRFGLPAMWVAVAFLMCGFLLSARILPESALRGSSWVEDLSAVVRNRRFWVLVVVSVSINVCWHFLVSWMPGYLRQDRGLTFLASGLWASVPFIAADVGNLGGGALSRYFARRGRTPFKARLMVMTGCILLVSNGAWIGLAESNAVVIALLACMATGAAAFMANYFAFAQEVSPKHTGLIVGILGGLGNLFAAGILPFAGWVKDQSGGFGPIFVLVGLLPFLGLAALTFGWGRDAEETDVTSAGMQAG